ncbi:non-specific lipid-transfer protein A-like [Nymphaea colorata]|uniref:non-specific lipid-transfer protein A-like n=1 Tax=Nymphaea colorata TaxID=210225 RepID=UPI00129DDE34|nr:non-specific lipid-transfer protein A-like [Nymphaea colorata]
MKPVVTLVVFLLAASTIDGRSLRSETVECESVYKTMEHCLPYVTGIADRPFPVCCDGMHRLRDIVLTHEQMVTTCECLKAKASGLRHLKESNLRSLPMDCGFQLHQPISLDMDCNK